MISIYSSRFAENCCCIFAFYKKEEKERTYLKAYEGYDRRQMRKMTHLERIDGKTVLFDYKNRDPLTGNAAIYYLSE